MHIYKAGRSLGVFSYCDFTYASVAAAEGRGELLPLARRADQHLD